VTDQPISGPAQDLEEVAAQLASGELDAPTAARLTRIYQTELAAASEPQQQPNPSRARNWIGTLVVAVGMAVIGWLVANAIQDRGPGGLPTGNIESIGGRDLSQVSNQEMEEVLVDYPDIIPMRLALAFRYFEAGDYSAALPHYLKVLEQSPDQPEALTNIGWMSFSSGEPEIGTRYLERAIAVADHPQARLFLGRIKLSQGDQQAARELLTGLLTDARVPAAVKAQVDRLLAEIG